MKSTQKSNLISENEEEIEDIPTNYEGRTKRILMREQNKKENIIKENEIVNKTNKLYIYNAGDLINVIPYLIIRKRTKDKKIKR